jgi:hypothetical protein
MAFITQGYCQMANENEKSPDVGQEPVQKSRRDFVKTSAQVAVTAPAVAMLLSSKPAQAVISPYQASQSHILDDFTFGNNEEDVDALNGRSGGGNFSNWNHAPVGDDHV